MRAVSVLLLLSTVAAADPVDGGVIVADAGGDPLTRLRAALLRCAPGAPLDGCVAALHSARLEVLREKARAIVPLGAPFVAVTIDARAGDKVVDVVFRGLHATPAERGDVAAYLDAHAGAFPFSETCPPGATFCGIFYPKQAGSNPAIEVGVGLIQLSGKPVWRKPPPVKVAGHTVYAPDERLLDVRRTVAEGFVVQFSLPLDRDGLPATTPPLLRPAFESFVRAPFLRLP